MDRLKGTIHAVISMVDIVLRPIGTIRTPFKEAGEAPIQPIFSNGIEGTVELDPAYSLGLKDLDGFSHIILLYHFHRSEGFELLQSPFLDREKHGVFSIRSPRRPNPIGLSVVRLLGIEGNILRISDVDMLDGTPLLDIKPYVDPFDVRKDVRIGWLKGRV
jgi:tRNA-Thr(GGU) m(6)t(6)A37 methyltransferase TsaA